MHKVKKKSKPGKIPKPIKVKKEKTEEDRTLHPMSHYIDDRLELVKQIFGSLKPKTITNLAPDFLKSKSMDEIEELCLNELLGISTKRLLSIINATKCPTDTESSGDSDVEHQEEHISLEEISSDSEIEGSSNAGKKKSSGADGKGGAKKSAKGTAKNDENNGQISVLELLELQARARAIRSQLALEPVTKIEVDSDGEKDREKNSNGKSTNGADSKEKKRKYRRKSSEKTKDTDKTQSTTTSSAARPPPTAKTSKDTTSTAAETPSTSNAKAKTKEDEAQPSKTNKLKKNYRAKNNDTKTTASESEKKSKNPELDAAPVAGALKEVKKEARSRSATPDVIPIIPEPETLLISDSSDAENDEMKKTKTAAAENSEANRDASKDREKPSRERKLTEPEEGEVREDQIEKNTAANSTDDRKAAEISVAQPIVTATTEIKETNSTAKSSKNSEASQGESAKPDNSHTAKPENNLEATSTAAISATVTTITTTTTSTTAAFPEEKEATIAPNIEDEDDRNDDVISLEGGDLEEEMIEHLEEDTNTKSSFATSPKRKNSSVNEDVDIISLDSSEEEERDKESSESWHSRYLKSSKVSKVLAASRLGKRVRDNIKKSKRSKKDSEREKAPDEKEKTGASFASKHEDGSVEQYKELLALRQRKKQ